MASFRPYLAEAMRPDPRYSEAINQNMQVPDHLAMGGGGPLWAGMREEEAGSRWRSEEPAASYNMHIPDRLTYTETPDLNPRPMFTASKTAQSNPLTLETCWENQGSREGDHRDLLHSPMRRSYSDQSFGRTPPDTPTHLKYTVAHLASPRGSGGSLSQCPTGPGAAMALPAGQAQAPEPPESRPSLLSHYPLLQAAWQLGQQASQRLLQAINHKYRFNDPEAPARARRAAEPSGPVLKMSRRLAGLERQNAERRNTEMLLFSLLLSACLLNGWLWVRR
ncbi:hypothetical protein CRUP_015348 [Coryphaenoides rupestris]|nr:hypothetical protein CRUP_015348 [Coryphaenoides rupestris]